MNCYSPSCEHPLPRRQSCTRRRKHATRSLCLLLIALVPLGILTGSPSTAAQTQPAPATQSAAHPDGTPKVRFSLETLLAPTDVLPIPGNESTEPNALGQYTGYAINLQIQKLRAHLRAGEYAPITEAITAMLRERTQDTNGMDIATQVVNALSADADIEPILLQWIEQEPQAQVAYSLYGSWCIDEAWRHRGSGWARDVTPEGWQGFGKYLSKAHAAFTQALELDPQDYVSAKQMITVALGLSGGFDRYKWFTRATAIYPDYYEAYSTFQYTLRPRWGGMPGQMKFFATQNAHRGPQFPLLLYRWMSMEDEEAFKTQGSPTADAAWEILQEYSKAFPESDNAYRDMSTMQANFDNKEEALRYAKKAVELDASAYNRYYYGYRLHALRENQQSIAEMKAAITLSPDVPLYWDWLGRNYFTIKARNMPLAIECFTRAIELGGDSRWLPVDRGRSYMNLGDIKAAIPSFEAATKRWPDFDQAYYNLGMALYRDGDREGAQRAFSRAIELNEKNEAAIEKFLSRQKQ